MAALGLFVGLVVNTALRHAADGTPDATAQRTRERAAALVGARPTASSARVSGRRLASTDSDALAPFRRVLNGRDQPDESRHRSSQVDVLASHVKRMRAITPAGAQYIDRMLHDVRHRGAASVPAIRDFLRAGEDVDFAKMTGGARVGRRTLREAVIDTLEEIGGSDAVAVSLEVLHQTTQPIEVVMLARAVEKEDPGLHGEEVIEAVANTLQGAVQAPPQQGPDVAPLFDLLRGYGGDDAVAVLEACEPQWREYSLIALAGLPDGAGIPSLAAFAETPGDGATSPALPLQMLAQAAAQHPEAGDAITDLAREGQIPDEVWNAIADALAGKQLQFSGTSLAANGTGASDPRPSPWKKSYYVEWMNVRYEEDVVTAAWSADQIAQQLALIDGLLETVSSPAAVEALQQARASLEAGSNT